MSFSSICKNATVIVDERGSGVLFQPMTEDYTYVLTAKHNLQNDDGSLISDVTLNITSEIHDSIVIEKIYRHQNNDIAIVKIRKIECEDVFIQIEEPSIDERYKCYGYPNTRDNRVIHNLSLQIRDFSTPIIEFTNDDASPLNEVIGFSGGGIFKENDGKAYLLGIEFGMHNYVDESNNIIKAVSIKAFDEIIEKNSNELVPLYPPYIADFNLLLNNIFILNNMEEMERSLVQQRLRKIAENLSKNIKPLDIKSRYKLLESHYEKKDYFNKELWSMYLEFMVISVFLDLCSPIDIKAIESIHKKRKFLYIKSHDWKEKKEEILKSDFTFLKKNSIVIICCDGDRTPTSCILKTKTLLDIGNGIMLEDFNISQGINSPHEDFKFKHIHAVQKQMIEDCDNGDSIFDGANASNIEGIIKDEIYKVFN